MSSGGHDKRFGTDPFSGLSWKGPLWAVLAWDVQSLVLLIQDSLCRPRRRPPSKVLWRIVLKRLSWCVTCLNQTSFRLLTVTRRGSCGPTKEVNLAPHQVVGLVFKVGDAEKCGSFSQSQQAGFMSHSRKRGWGWHETCTTSTYLRTWWCCFARSANLAIAAIAGTGLLPDTWNGVIKILQISSSALIIIIIIKMTTSFQYRLFPVRLSTSGGSTLYIVLFVEYGHGPCRFDAKAFLIISTGDTWFDPVSFVHCLDVCNRKSSHWCAASVLIIETPSASKFTKPEEDLGSRRSILAKKLLQILKGLLLMQAPH